NTLRQAARDLPAPNAPEYNTSRSVARMKSNCFGSACTSIVAIGLGRLLDDDGDALDSSGVLQPGEPPVLLRVLALEEPRGRLPRLGVADALQVVDLARG